MSFKNGKINKNKLYKGTKYYEYDSKYDGVLIENIVLVEQK